MGHADLRIRERTLPVVADRAYELLRSSKTLALAAEVVLSASDRPNADRVAFALEDGDAPARLVVTRDGRAVTCLAEGMACDAVTAPFVFTTGYLERQRQELRQRLAENRAKDPEARDTLARLWRFAYCMTREEFEALLPLAPLLLGEQRRSTAALRDALITLEGRSTWDIRKPVVREFGEAVWRLYCCVATLTVLTHREPGASWSAISLLGATDSLLTQRAWWVVLAHPERTLEEIRMMSVNGPRPLGQGLCVMACAAVAARFPWLRREAAQVARAIGASPLARPETAALAEQLLNQDLYRRRIEASARLLAAYVVVERAASTQAHDACATPAANPDHDAEVKRVLEEWAPLEGMETQPVPSLRREDTLSPAEVRRIALWREAIWRNPRAISPTYQELGVVLSNAPMEAVVPSSSPMERNSLTEGTRFVLERLPGVLNQYRQEEVAAEAAARPQKATPRVGRNERCPCGSGKKSKKCCGAP